VNTSLSRILVVMAVGLMLTGCASTEPPARACDDAELKLARSAERMIRSSRGRLAPVYAPLAEQIVTDLSLADVGGVGIDVGSGPGTLIIELCKRTKLHWINADINPHFFSHFLARAEACGVGHRISAIRTDAQDMPFRSNYADVVVSRGSYHFWPNQIKAFGEIYRILKPGGQAYIGRGFSRDLPPAVARAIRAEQGKGMNYDRVKREAELRKTMTTLGIKDYRIHTPVVVGGEDVNYGIWIEIRKPLPKVAR